MEIEAGLPYLPECVSAQLLVFVLSYVLFFIYIYIYYFNCAGSLCMCIFYLVLNYYIQIWQTCNSTNLFYNHNYYTAIISTRGEIEAAFPH